MFCEAQQKFSLCVSTGTRSTLCFDFGNAFLTSSSPLSYRALSYLYYSHGFCKLNPGKVEDNRDLTSAVLGLFANLINAGTIAVFAGELYMLSKKLARGECHIPKANAKAHKHHISAHKDRAHEQQLYQNLSKLRPMQLLNTLAVAFFRLSSSVCLDPVYYICSGSLRLALPHSHRTFADHPHDHNYLLVLGR